MGPHAALMKRLREKNPCSWDFFFKTRLMEALIWVSCNITFFFFFFKASTNIKQTTSCLGLYCFHFQGLGPFTYQHDEDFVLQTFVSLWVLFLKLKFLACCGFSFSLYR